MIRNRVLCAVFVGGLAAAACSQQGPAASSNGGSSGNGGSGGSSSSVANGGSGGSNEGGSNAGGSAAGGANAGGSAAGGSAAGGSNTGGSAAKGSGGAAAGGALGSGGAAQGGSAAGGSSAGGSAAGGATTSSGSGGATPKGGAVGSGGAGAGGAVGSGGAAAGGSTGTIDPASVVPDLDGFYWEGTCSGNVAASNKNCPMYDNGATSCPTAGSWSTRGTIRDKTLTVKGTSGTQYTVTIDVRGVVGSRCYTGGKPASTATPSDNGPNNSWYVGGSPSSTGDIWNTYELHVDPPVPNEANVYYLNAFPSSPDYCQKEGSFEVKYTASFKVMGGGTMKFTIHDSNCQGQQNCGSNFAATTCDSPRKVDLSGMSPAATFNQPPTNTVGTKTYYPQWLYFDVKSVTSP